jgi:cell division protein FtsB
MKKTLGLVWLFFVLLLAANIYIFLSGMNLSEKINTYEKETKRLRQENIDLEAKAYEANSLQHAASRAAELDFSKKAEPYFLDNLRVALKNQE